MGPVGLRPRATQLARPHRGCVETRITGSSVVFDVAILPLRDNYVLGKSTNDFAIYFSR